jgi:hypothetical protein
MPDKETGFPHRIPFIRNPYDSTGTLTGLNCNPGTTDWIKTKSEDDLKK